MRYVIPALVLTTTTAPASAMPLSPNRINISLQQDFGVAAAADPCSREAQLQDGFACFRQDGSQYHGTPTNQSEAAGSLAPATTRILLGYDRFVLEPLSLGIRVGAALGGGPKPDGANAPTFLPLHVEGRASYWLGAPASEAGWRAGAFLAGGLAQLDTRFQTLVVEDTNSPPPSTQLDNPSAQTLDAYHKAGTGFFGGGLALAIAPCVTHAFFLEAKVMWMFPSGGLALAPVLGYDFGF